MEWLNTSWKLLLLRGVVGVIFGIAAIVWPLSTTFALAILWGIWAIADGIASAVEAVSGGAGRARVLAALSGLVALLAGCYAIARPGATAVTLTWVLGIWLLVRGGVEVISAFGGGLSTAARAALALGAAVDLLLGLLFVLNPGRSAVTLAVTLGLMALVWGLVFIVAAFVIRSQEHDLMDSPGASPAL